MSVLFHSIQDLILGEERFDLGMHSCGRIVPKCGEGPERFFLLVLSLLIRTQFFEYSQGKVQVAQEILEEPTEFLLGRWQPKSVVGGRAFLSLVNQYLTGDEAVRR